jgi:ubiquitin C-terminal hydrolase
MSDLFLGQKVVNYECTHCHFESKVYESAPYLSVPIHTQDVSRKVGTCINQFWKKKEFSMHCESCDTVQLHYMQNQFSKLPQILVVQLKRFNQRFEKVDLPVSIEENLDLGAYSVDSEKSRSSYKLW